MDAREVEKIAKSVFNAKKYELRTHIFVKVLEYDAESNIVKVQPVRKAIRFTDPENPESVELPPMAEIIVRQIGSGKLWLTVAPQPDTYGYLHVSDRDIDAWKKSGGVGDPTDVRCMDLRDAVFEPSLLHLGEEGDLGKFEEPIKTDRISIRTRSGLTEISILDDESVTVNVNDGNATLIIDADGNITITSKGDVSISADGNVSTDAIETALQAGTDYAVQYTALKSAFDTLKSDLNNFVIWATSHVHPGVLAGAASTAVSPVPPVQSSADMSGSKISDVRLP